MLDPLPTNFEGYEINSDFRIGIQIALCADDSELQPYEKTYKMIELLYKEVPDAETAMRGLQWFMSCGKAASKEDANSPNAMSFDYDDSRIFSAFLRVYHIDLTTEKLHWFKFLPMLQDIGGTALESIIGYRTADTSKMKGEQRTAYEKMKRVFALPNNYSEEEQEAIDSFLAQLNQSRQVDE